MPWALKSEGTVSPALPGSPRLDLRGERVLVEIPSNLARLKASDPAAARLWRESTRMVFRRYFAQGYAAVDAAAIPTPSGARVAYVLEREDRSAKGASGEDRGD